MMAKNKLGILLLAAAITVGVTGCKDSVTVKVGDDEVAIETKDKTGTTEEKNNEEAESSPEAKTEESPKTTEESKQNIVESDSQSNVKNNVLEEYKQVLRSTKQFKSVDEDGKETYLNQFAYFNGSQLDSPYKITRFAVLDMDSDDIPEVVVELDTGFDGAFEVLHCIDETVYGYNFNFRSINKLYEDGYYMGVSGASDWVISQISFTASGYSEEEMAGCNNGDYTIEGTSVSQAEYEYYAKKYFSKEAVWHEFNESNLEKAFVLEENKTEDSNSSKDITITGKTPGYIFYSQEEYLTEEDVKYLPKDILKIARNEIYAQHGYIFTTNDMKQFFEQKEWYSGTIDSSEWSDEKYLNNYERKNVQLISKYEKKATTEQALNLYKSGDKTIATDGSFSITLPAVWEENNFVVQKCEDTNHTAYVFYSKNNLKYGAGGHVFTILKYHNKTSASDIDFYDNLTTLGDDGKNYYFMGQGTDVQFCYTESELSKEWSTLNSTYEEIANSFSIE